MYIHGRLLVLQTTSLTPWKLGPGGTVQGC